MRNTQPNILLILTDQQRFDSLGCYGSKAVATPNLDRLAAEGVRFTNCYVNNTICTPSRASIWTGKPLIGHKVYKLHDILSEREVLFSSKLKERGYTTALFGKLHVSARMFERDSRHKHDGFDVYEEAKSPYCAEAKHNGYVQWLKSKHPEFYHELKAKGRTLGSFPEATHFTRWLSERTIDYIQHRDVSAPFFCCMSIFDPHDPYNDAPSEAMQLVDESEIREFTAASENERMPEAISRERQHGYLKGLANYSKEQLLEMRRGYYASIAFMDKEVGKVLNVLEEEGIKDNTVVIFTSDHGDMLGDHNLLAKGAFFYDPCVRVPLIARFNEEGFENTVSDEIVQPSDIAATILSCAGFTDAENKQYAPHSNDLKRKVHAEGAEADSRFAVCMYRNSAISDNKLYWEPPINATMLRNKRYKLNVYHDNCDISNQRGEARGELYDMVDDPHEQSNLWNNKEYGGIKMELLLQLMDWMVQTDSLYNGASGGEWFPPKSHWSMNNPI